MIVSAIGAVIFGTLFGFLGIAATVVRWFSYDYSRKKMGTLISIIVRLTAGLATYGIATFGLISMFIYIYN